MACVFLFLPVSYATPIPLFTGLQAHWAALLSSCDSRTSHLLITPPRVLAPSLHLVTPSHHRGLILNVNSSEKPSLSDQTKLVPLAIIFQQILHYPSVYTDTFICVIIHLAPSLFTVCKLATVRNHVYLTPCWSPALVQCLAHSSCSVSICGLSGMNKSMWVYT